MNKWIFLICSMDHHKFMKWTFTWTGMPPFITWCPSGCWWCCWCWCWCWGWNDEPICCCSWLFIICCIIGWEKPPTLTFMLCSRPCKRGICSSAGDGWREPGVRLERLWKLQLLVTKVMRRLEWSHDRSEIAKLKLNMCSKLTWILCHRQFHSCR